MRRGTHHDPEVRARMSAARRKTWADPEVRARMSAARRKTWAAKDADGTVCQACIDEKHLLCDGDGCRCPCSLEMDLVRRRPRTAAAGGRG
jgi:hypothetical protein